MEQITERKLDGAPAIGNKGITHWEKAGMSREEWKEATKFDSTDWGWIIMSIGMAIGSGIVFLPVQVGLVGLWIFLMSAVISYPIMYGFQRLYINTLASSPRCEDYAGVISGYLGKNWGFFLGIIYFVMIIMGVMMYSTAITNDSASFLLSFGVTDTNWSENPLYGLAIIVFLVAVASRGEAILFKVSTGMVLTKLIVIAILGIVMIPHWNIANVENFPDWGYFIKETIVMLPFTLCSILFIQSISPMVISYRTHNTNVEVAWYKSIRAMNIAFGVLFVTVFFYAVSFNLAMGHEQAVEAAANNISSLAMAARGMEGSTLKILSLLLNIFAITTAFFGVFLGFREACQGIAMNVMRRLMPEERINKKAVSIGILIFAILFSWGSNVLNFPVLLLLSFFGPIVGIVGCLMPAYLVHRVDFLHCYKGIMLNCIVLMGLLLLVSPFLQFL